MSTPTTPLKKDMQHLVGRPLIPFFTPNEPSLQENVDRKLLPTDFAVDSVPVRSFVNGYFEEAKAVGHETPRKSKSNGAGGNVQIAQATTPLSVSKKQNKSRKHAGNGTYPGPSDDSVLFVKQSTNGSKKKGVTKPAESAPTRYAGPAFANSPSPNSIPLPAFLRSASENSIPSPDADRYKPEPTDSSQNVAVRNLILEMLGKSPTTTAVGGGSLSSSASPPLLAQNHHDSLTPALHFLSPAHSPELAPTKIEIPLQSDGILDSHGSPAVQSDAASILLHMLSQRNNPLTAPTFPAPIISGTPASPVATPSSPDCPDPRINTTLVDLLKSTQSLSPPPPPADRSASMRVAPASELGNPNLLLSLLRLPESTPEASATGSSASFSDGVASAEGKADDLSVVLKSMLRVSSSNSIPEKSLPIPAKRNRHKKR